MTDTNTTEGVPLDDAAELHKLSLVLKHIAQLSQGAKIWLRDKLNRQISAGDD